VEPRLVPVNAVLDLSLADGLNPAPLAGAGWAVAALEVPVRVGLGTVVCDIVLFNAGAGHLLVVEVKSGANLEPEQGRKLTALTPGLLILAGGITVPQPVSLQCEVLYACLAENADRIALGADEAASACPFWPSANGMSGSSGRSWPVPGYRPRLVHPSLGHIRLPGLSPSITSHLPKHLTSRSVRS
jgi:hypothetical protein